MREIGQHTSFFLLYNLNSKTETLQQLLQLILWGLQILCVCYSPSPFKIELCFCGCSSYCTVELQVFTCVRYKPALLILC